MANQLIRENNQAAGQTWTWEYDAAGNILCKNEYAYTTGTVAGATGQWNYSYGNAEWGDLLTVFNGLSFQYDAIGNLIDDEIWQYTWEHGRQLASMADGDTGCRAASKEKHNTKVIRGRILPPAFYFRSRAEKQLDEPAFLCYNGENCERRQLP